MTARELTTVAAVGLASATGVYALDQHGQSRQEKLVLAITGLAEVTGAEASAVLLDDAGQARHLDGKTVRCAVGGNLDGVYRKDKEWCTDGAGQAWVRDAKGPQSFEVIGGKVYSVR